MNSLVKSEYLKNGFYVTKPLIDEKYITSLRKELEKEFESHEDVVSINITDFKNSELIKKIIQLINSDQIQDTVNNLQVISQKKISLLPILEVHKNYHVNLREFLGWHRDAGGEMRYKYCSDILKKKDYIFSKVGIYLQNNSEYGGSIDIVQKSHKNFSNLTVLIRKIKNIPLRLVMLLHKYLNKLYLMIPESFFMYFINAKTLHPERGSAVFFDSRLIHRGSPISKNKIKEIKYLKGKFKAILPKDKDKYSIYFQLGSTESVDSYMYDRLSREGNSNELNIWLKQIKIIEKYDKQLSSQMSQTLRSVKEKYKDFLNNK